MTNHNRHALIVLALLAMLGAAVATAQDSPPTPFIADFEAGDGSNNYGGGVLGFYGLGNPFFQDDNLIVNSFPGGAGTGGSFAWNATDGGLSLIAGANFTFFGHIVQFSAGGTTPQNVTNFTELAFEARLGSPTAYSNYYLRFEDVDPTGGGDFNNVAKPLSDYGTINSAGYTTFVVPFADFQNPGDGQLVDFTRLSQLAIVNAPADGAGTLGGSPASFEINILFDNVRLQGNATPSFDSPPTDLFDDYNDGDLVNNYGGGVDQYYARLFPLFQDNGLITATAVDGAGTVGGSGDYALHFDDGGTPLPAGTALTLFGHIFEMSAGAATGQDLSSFNAIRFDARVGSPTAFTDYFVRLEDTVPSGGGKLANVSVPLSGYGPLTTTYRTFIIPLADFLPGDGSQEVDITDVNRIILDNDWTAAGPYEIDLFVDNFEITTLNLFDMPPTPMVMDFANGEALNNYGGDIGLFYGFGNPFTQNDARLSADFDDQSGRTGMPGDYAMRVSDGGSPLTGGPDFVFFGHFIRLSPGPAFPNDISGFDTLSFDARLGAPGDFADYVIRFEDATPTGAGEFNNASVSMADYGTLSTAWQTFTIPLGDFVPSGAPQVVDFTEAIILTWASSGATTPGSIDVDIFIDNVRIGNGALAADDWILFE